MWCGWGGGVLQIPANVVLYNNVEYGSNWMHQMYLRHWRQRRQQYTKINCSPVAEKNAIHLTYPVLIHPQINRFRRFPFANTQPVLYRDLRVCLFTLSTFQSAWFSDALMGTLQ